MILIFKKNITIQNILTVRFAAAEVRTVRLVSESTEREVTLQTRQHTDYRLIVQYIEFILQYLLK